MPVRLSLRLPACFILGSLSFALPRNVSLRLGRHFGLKLAFEHILVAFNLALLFQNHDGWLSFQIAFASLPIIAVENPHAFLPVFDTFIARPVTAFD